MAQQISESELVLRNCRKLSGRMEGSFILPHLGRIGKRQKRMEEQHRTHLAFSPGRLVSTLLRQDILSADELKEIETFWRKENE